MRRIGLLTCMIAGLALFTPPAAQASPVQCTVASATCVTIGEFSWSRDDIFGDVFAVNNLSAGALAGNFSSIAVNTDAGVSAFSPDPLAPLNPTEALDLFAGVTSATLSFVLGGGAFSSTLLEGDLVFDAAAGTSFASRLVLAELQSSTAPQPVPEPASMLLLGTGLGLLRAVRRARSR